MSVCVLCLNVCKLCVPNIMRIGRCFKKIAALQNWRIFLIQRQNSRYYGCSVWKTKVDKKANLHKNWNMQIADSIVEYFEQFSQMLTKSILIISSYTVSNLVRFFRDSVSLTAGARNFWASVLSIAEGSRAEVSWWLFRYSHYFLCAQQKLPANVYNQSQKLMQHVVKSCSRWS